MGRPRRKDPYSRKTVSLPDDVWVALHQFQKFVPGPPMSLSRALEVMARAGLQVWHEARRKIEATKEQP